MVVVQTYTITNYREPYQGGKKWNGDEEWYDRADNRLEGSTVKAIESLLPLELTNAIEEEFIGEEPPDTSLTLEQFKPTSAASGF